MRRFAELCEVASMIGKERRIVGDRFRESKRLAALEPGLRAPCNPRPHRTRDDVNDG